MAVWNRLSGRVKPVVAASGLMLLLGGCAYDEPPRREVYRDRVYEREPVRVEREVVRERVYEPAPREVVTTYERDLQPYGEWVEVREYGRCWRPHGRPHGWRPYTVGHWVDTNEGYSWVAEESEADWGVVTYHYGRWYEDRSSGWVWVPGSTYSPAWVSWREGGGYCGWAPLPPQVGYGPGVSVAVIDRYVPADRYVYVEDRYIGERRVHERFVRNDVTIINRTTNITNITIVNERVVNHGVPLERVREHGGRVERMEVTRVTSYDEARRLRSEGRPVAYEPENVARADREYRARVERRNKDEEIAQKEERARVERRNANETAAQKAERARVERRMTDAEKAKEDERARVERRATDANAAERARVQRRNGDETAAEKAERARVERRMTDAEKAKEAERARVERRTTDDAAAERARVERRNADAAAAKQAEQERAARRAQPDAGRQPPLETTEKERANRRAADAAAAKQAEQDRAARRAQPDGKQAPVETTEKERANRRAADAEAARQAEHERAVRRAKDADAEKAKNPNQP